MTRVTRPARATGTPGSGVRAEPAPAPARFVLAALALTCACITAAAEDQSTSGPDRQRLEDAWWTGPLLAAGAGTLPKGHFLFEPYVFDIVSKKHFDADGKRQDTPRIDTLGSQSYLLYGLTDRITAGLIPRFAFNRVSGGRDTSGLLVGDLTLQAQYRLTQFEEGSWVPTTSFVFQETLPTGKHDRLGERPADGFGGGAYTTTLALFSQYYFWMPNGRILRTRFNIQQSFSNDADVDGVSVYGTGEGFRGEAKPGNSFLANAAWEYSLTRNWVLAMDVAYQRDRSTRVQGEEIDPLNDALRNVDRESGSSWSVALAPAIEYNLSSTVGVIVGVRWYAAGRNTGASITPVAAINLVY